MCGMAGAAGSLQLDDDKFIRSALIYNSTRGEDSTGLGSITRNNQVRLAKELGNPFELFYTNRRKDAFLSYDDVIKVTNKVFIGHCRSATRGTISRKNAHPFYFDNTLGSHNGTIPQDSHNRLAGKRHFETDSQAIFNEIEGEGIEKTIEKLNDFGSIVWYNIKDETINFIRDNTRPLHVVFSEDGKKVYWSSLAEHLYSAMSDSKIKMKDKPLLLPELTWFSLKVPDYGTQFSDPERKVLKAHEVASSTTFFRGQNTRTGSEHSYTNSNSEDWHRVGVHDLSTQYYDAMTKTWKDRETHEPVENEIVKRAVLELKNKRAKNRDEMNDELPFIPDNPKHISMLAKDLKEKRSVIFQRENGVWEIYRDVLQAVYWNNKEKEYWIVPWQGSQLGWSQLSMEKMPSPPKYVPMTRTNINGSHALAWKKTGKTKLMFFKGYNGSLLAPKVWHMHMQKGCAHCDRVPEAEIDPTSNTGGWFNEVLFINKNHDFLCSFCSKVPETVKLLSNIV